MIEVKIGIVGNYGNNNNGDEAILQGIIRQLEDHFHVDRGDLLVFSNQPSQTEERYHVQAAPLYVKKTNAYTTLLATVGSNTSRIRQLDLLIIGGGGILMDLYGREAILYGMYGWLGKLTGCPVVVYGVGAGPILTKKGAFMIRSLAQLSKFVSVRDPKSKELLESIGVKKEVHVIGDPAFQMPEPAKTNKNDSPKKIGVTAVPYYHKSYWPTEDQGKYQSYIKGMAANLDEMVGSYSDVEVTFFATKHPQDMWVTQDIVKEMSHPQACHIIEEALAPEEIVRVASEQDLVIGTRLHSLILSLVSETPIVAVSYHHKVRDFMEMLDCPEDVIDIEELNKDGSFFMNRYTYVRNHWNAHQKKYEKVSNQMKERSTKGLPYVEKALK